MMTPEASMANQIPQTYANHRRIDPLYHMVGFGLLLAALVLAVTHLIRQPGLGPVWELIASLAMLLSFFLLRGYALRNQDRLIRLEETLRLERLLTEPLRSRIQALNQEQFIGLRFAPDEELGGLVEQVLAENLDRETIKRRIRVWRPDEHRV
jgi:hypothetical protein